MIDEATATVSTWLHLMGEDLLPVGIEPADRDRTVSGVAFYDPLDDASAMRNTILLITGIDCRSDVFDDVLAQAWAQGAAAVVVKSRGASLEELQADSRAHHVPIIVARDAADWTRLAAVARTALSGAAVDSVSGVRLGDMFAFANAVATLTSGATSIVDSTGHIVGYSTIPGQPIDDLRRETTLTLQERTVPMLDEEYQYVYSSDVTRFLPATSERGSRIAIAVRAGGELLGSIWVIDPGDERRAHATETLDRLAPLAGLHMLHARTASDFTERRNADLMRTLLNDPEHASFAAAQLGLGAEYSAGFAVAVFTIAHVDPGGVDAVREQQRLRQLVTLTCDLRFQSSYTALIDAAVYALLPGHPTSGETAHRRLIEDIGGHRDSVSADVVVAAVGSAVPGLGELHRSRDEAVLTLELLLGRIRADRGSAHPTTGVYRDHAIELDLRAVGRFIADHNLGRFDVIDRIRRHDVANQTDFLATLRAYLDANGNVAQTAKRMHLHGNTIRYRVARLVEDFGIDFDEPTVRLWLWLRLTSGVV